MKFKITLKCSYIKLDMIVSYEEMPKVIGTLKRLENNRNDDEVEILVELAEEDAEV